jgi:serine/tyrosine/threonine adenylyltransferase
MQFELNNRFTEQLPADPIEGGSPRQVSQACYSFVEPTPVAKPERVCVSNAVAEQLNLSLSDISSREFSQVFCGNQLIADSKPYAMCYGGHQFGHWAGQLGDGRAINLAEVIDANGANQVLQLKGAGLTPYSRTADGLAVLRSSVREFLCSEAMYYLGVPTTRALSLHLTGEQVMRDMFYDGNAALEKGAIVCRVAPSFVRFGNFQIHAARGEKALLKQLVDFVIKTEFSELINADDNATGTHSPEIDSSEVITPDMITTETYEAWFDKICTLTAEMITGWMRVGFVHGVMNTDNLSILGLTIDYGPYGWLEGYDPDWTPNTTDAQGKRYCFGSQPQIAQWNCFQLANAIADLVGRTEKLEQSLANFADYYTKLSQQMYADKLGLANHLGDSDQKLIDQLFVLLQLTETDMTIFFRCLAGFKQNKAYSADEVIELVASSFYKINELNDEIKQQYFKWFKDYAARLKVNSKDSSIDNDNIISDEQRAEKMNQVNPKYVMRNYLAQQAIDKANLGDYSEVEKLLLIMQKPYDEQPEFEVYAQKRPEWARQKAGCSMLSCSS